MKKIFSSLIIFSLLVTQVSSSFATDNYTGNYAQYMPSIEKKIDAMNAAEIQTFQNAIADVIRETDNGETKDFLKSILLLTAQEQTTTSSEIITDTIDSSIISYSELSESEQRSITKEITKMQKSLKGETQDMLSQMITSWNNLSRYTERGNMQANMEMSIENILELEAGMNISEYFAENQSLDSSITADIDGFYNANSIFVDQINLSGNTKLEIIQKGSDTYLLMRDTEFSTENDELEIELTPLVEKLTELAQDNTYINFSDEKFIDSYAIVDFLNSDNIKSEIDMMFSQNLMQAYGKNENGYLLRPTKHFCDMGKRIINVFDPFNGKDCSENQYADMLEDFENSGTEIALDIGKSETTLSISNANALDAYETANMQLVWRNGSFREMNMSVVDTTDQQEYFSMQYISQRLFEIQIPKQQYNPEFLLSMQLGRNNSIKNANLKSSYENEFMFTANYDNGKLEMSMEVDVPEVQALCEFGGNAYMNSLNISGSCDIYSPMIDTESQSISLTSSIDYLGGNTNNNFSWILDAVSDENNYLSINILSSGKRQSSGVYEIERPENTINYLDFLSEVQGDDYYMYEADYEFEYNEYDDYTESCYIYDSGDTTCYKYYDNKDVTCQYSAETDTENCEEYIYDYTIQNNSYDEYEETCYLYDSGDTTCYKYYDDKDVTCQYSAETDTENCEEYIYNY